MVESKLVELVVAGSSPVGHPKNFSSQLLLWPALGISFHTLQSVNFGQAIIGQPQTRSPNRAIRTPEFRGRIPKIPVANSHTLQSVEFPPVALCSLVIGSNGGVRILMDDCQHVTAAASPFGLFRFSDFRLILF